MNALTRLGALAAAFAVLAGCATTSLEESAARTSRRVADRAGNTPAWPPPETPPATVPDEPLTLDDALALAFARNPDMRRFYARIGIAQADLQSASRIANPRISFAWLDPAGGGRDKTTRGIAATFTDLLLLPSRRRLSAAGLERTELAVSHALLVLAKDVEAAWFAAVGAGEAAKRREAAAEAAETAATLAARYREAGNLPQEDLDAERIHAADARAAALAARADAAEARAKLATLTGLASTDAWEAASALPAPPEAPLAADGLVARARAQRFDLAAAELEVRMLESALSTAKRRRFLPPAEAGWEWEREPDGTKLDGPTLALELPVFDQGQGPIAHAEATLLDARARHDALEAAVANGVTASVARLEASRGIAEQGRLVRLPAVTSAAARSAERTGYMLDGPFTLLRAQAARLEAEADWLLAVRDYWIERAALRAQAGGALPGDDEARPPATIPEAPGKPEPSGHEHHGDGT